MDSQTAPSQPPERQARSPGPIDRLRGRVRRWRQDKWYLDLLFVGVGAVAAWGAADLYDSVKPWRSQTDGYLARLQADQREGFKSIEATLDTLRGSLPQEGREAFRSLQSSIDGLERQSGGLLQQLALAKAENDALRTQLQAKTGLAGGYDFIVGEDASMRIDARTVLGVTAVGAGGARVNLTTAGDDGARNVYLDSGESLGYRAADGRACKVTLVSTRDGDVGAASFALGCG